MHEKVDNGVAQEKELGFGIRHIQAFLMFICLTIGYGMRVTMSVAIVAITDKTNFADDENTFDWSKKTQGIILSSFFWGYTIMQIPGGHISHKYGAKYLLGVGLTLNGLIALLLPTAAKLAGWKAVCVCRVIQGLAQGAFLPSLHTLLGKWAPLNERGRINIYVYGGGQIGTILVMALSGYLAATWGWPAIFYCCGSLCIIWGLIWLKFGAESPAVHKSISLKEKLYIQKSLGQSDDKKKMKVPWKLILTTMPVWAIAFAHAGSGWVQVTLFTEVPSYLNKIMGINLKANGFLSALPFIGMWLSGLMFSSIFDRVVNKKIFSLTMARKLANTIGTCGAAIGFVILAFLPKDNITLAVILLIFSAGMKAATFIGFHVNHIDISPNFAGTLMSISNTASNFFGTLAPLTAGLVLKNEYDIIQWRTVFCIVAGVVFITNLLYIIFGSAEKVAWNEPEYFEKEMTEITSDKLLKETVEK